MRVSTAQTPPETELDATRSRANQPWRGGLAAAELVLAALLLVAAGWCWHRGVLPIPMPAPGGGTDVVTRMYGSWIGTAIALGGLAALLVVDAARELLLALRAPRRRR